MKMEKSELQPKSPKLRQLLTAGGVGLTGALFFGPGILLAHPKSTSLEEVAQENRMPGEITKETIAGLDQKAFQLVREVNLPPTLAARLYAYLAKYQEQAYGLASHHWGKNVGDLNVLSAEVVSQLFPDKGLEKHFMVSNPDRMSVHLSDAISKQSKDRLMSEQLGLQIYPLMKGDQFWVGANPVTPEAGSFSPWYLDRNDQFRPAPPPLRGYMEDPGELEAVWDAVSNRTPEQEAAIKYWAGGKGTETPGGIWMNILNERVIPDPTISLPDYLKMRSMLTGTIADAFNSCWDAKYAYCVQRPVQCDPELESKLAIPTPNFPTYTSGHSTISGAAAEVLAHFLPAEGDKFRTMAVEASDSRIWAGIHFPVDCSVGLTQGEQIANFCLARN
jgi:hypothetical protein